VPLSSVPLFLSERKRGRGKRWDVPLVFVAFSFRRM